MVLSEVVVELVGPEQEARFRDLMQAHHYLGALPKIGKTLWYVAHLNGAWLAPAVFSAAALKCRARDAWVGWDFRTQYGRLHLVSNNTRLRNGVRKPPCQSTIRTILISVDPEQLDRALQHWHQQHGGDDEALAIDGKTLRNAIDKQGQQAHVMSVVGHHTKATYTQESPSSPVPTTRPNAPTKSAPSPRSSTSSKTSPARPSPPMHC